MEHLEDNFRENGQFHNTNAQTIQKRFELAMSENNEEVLKALIFTGSPILSAEVHHKKVSYLHLCCSYTQASIVIAQLLIDFGINIDKQDINGDTALHTAVQSFIRLGRVINNDIVKLLLKNGANRDIRNKMGFTPIQFSLFKRNLEVAEEFLKEEDKLRSVMEVDRTKRCQHLVKCLLRERNDWNIPSSSYSILLHFLAFENDEETFEYVANNTKFDVNAVNHEGHMLLHLVAANGTPRMIRALINVGADLEAENNYEDGYRETPLTYALRYNRIENAHCLLDCGASVNKFARVRLETYFPLHYAVCVQSFEIIERLVKKGADVNVLTYHRSPLLLACGSIDSEKWSQITDGLSSVFYKASKILGHTVANTRYFPFSLKIVEFLLDHGADIEAKTATNRTSLDQACKLGRLDIVKLLLSRGAKINQGDVSTLHHAVRGKNPAIVQLILKLGANVNYRCAPEKVLWEINDNEGPPPRTPLECAILFCNRDCNCKDIIEILMEYGVNVNVSDPVRKETPLHLACLSSEENHFIICDAKSRLATIKLLLRGNANVNALDSDGLTPLYYALRNYNLIISGNIPSNLLEPDLVTLIALIAKMIEKKEGVIEENLILLEDESARPIYQKCVNELSIMKKNICESRNFSFFNILSEDIEYLGRVLKNKDVLQVLKSGEYKKNFPIYAEYLEDRILEASTRQRLVDLAIVLFQKHVHKNLLVELILNI